VDKVVMACMDEGKTDIVAVNSMLEKEGLPMLGRQ
jgi:hypothetical protein